jgi:hypothetical protein
MASPPYTAPSTGSAIAAVLMGVQGALAGLTGIVYLALARHPRRRFFGLRLAVHPHLTGLILLLVAVLLLVFAVGIGTRRIWARVPTYILEAIIAVVSIIRFHPLRSLVGFLLALAVVILVAVSRPAGARRG